MRAFAADGQLAVREPGVEIGQLHDHVDAGADRERREAVRDGQQRCGRAAGRAGTRHVPDVDTRGGLQQVRVVREVAVQPGDIGADRSPFWGP